MTNKNDELAFYEVTLTMQTTRWVIANSKEEAEEKVDRSDMVHELKNYRSDETLSSEKIEGRKPTTYDIIEDIGEQISKLAGGGSVGHYTMSEIRKLYGDIRKLNKMLVKQGQKPVETPRSLTHYTESFIESIKKPV